MSHKTRKIGTLHWSIWSHKKWKLPYLIMYEFEEIVNWLQPGIFNYQPFLLTTAHYHDNIWSSKDPGTYLQLFVYHL